MRTGWDASHGGLGRCELQGVFGRHYPRPARSFREGVYTASCGVGERTEVGEAEMIFLTGPSGFIGAQREEICLLSQDMPLPLVNVFVTTIEVVLRYLSTLPS